LQPVPGVPPVRAGGHAVRTARVNAPGSVFGEQAVLP